MDTVNITIWICLFVYIIICVLWVNIHTNNCLFLVKLVEHTSTIVRRTQYDQQVTNCLLYKTTDPKVSKYLRPRKISVQKRHILPNGSHILPTISNLPSYSLITGIFILH
ncbi:MAG TPA: hypothetical protein PK548_00155 [Bacteroidales bacterium]|nr:hypothetical protein [Bacteroidales bacterium]